MCFVPIIRINFIVLKRHLEDSIRENVKRGKKKNEKKFIHISTSNIRWLTRTGETERSHRRQSLFRTHMRQATGIQLYLFTMNILYSSLLSSFIRKSLFASSPFLTSSYSCWLVRLSNLSA